MTATGGDPRDSDPARSYLGLTADQARELARRDHRPIRVLAPGSIVTMEYVENRINVTVVDDLVVSATTG